MREDLYDPIAAPKSRWQLLPLKRSLGEHCHDWDSLNAQRSDRHVLLDSRFIEALLRNFGRGDELLVICLRGGQLRSMCILRPSKRGLGIWSSFLPSQAQVGPTLLSADSDVAALLRALPGLAIEIDFLCNDPLFGDLRRLKHRWLHSESHALTIQINLAGSFDDYWLQWPKKLLQNIRRYERRVEAQPRLLRLRCVTEAAQLPEAVARYAALEGKGWKGRQGSAVSPDGKQGRFYTELMQGFAVSEGAVAYELWLGDDLMASRLTLADGRMVVMLKIAYDETFERFAPGRLLLKRVIEHLFTARNASQIEFYTNVDADQLAWATGQRWINHVSVYRNSAAALLLSLVRRAPWRPFGRVAPDPVPPTSTRRPATNLAIEVYRHPREFPTDVRELLREAELLHIELGVDWFENLIDQVFAQHPGVSFHLLRRDKRPVALLPILVNNDAGRWGAGVGSLSNYYTAIYAPIMGADVIGREFALLLKSVKQLAPNAAHFRFGPMDPLAASYAVLMEALKLAGLRPFNYFSFGNWYLPVQGDWADYLKDRKGSVRSTLKRMHKKLSADGGTLELVTGGPELETKLAAYQQVYAASWKGKEPYLDFVPGLMRRCAERGWLRLGLAWLNGRPIAAQLWIVANGRANIYKVAYDEDFKPYAPGTLLTALLIQHAMEQDKVHEIDYLIGDDPYKETWMSHRRERWGIVAYDPYTLGGLGGWLRELAGRAVKRIRARIKHKTVAEL